MSTKRLARAALGVVLVIAAALLAWSPSSVEAQPSPCDWGDCDNWMSVDSAGPILVGQTVDIDVSIDFVSTAYYGYNALIEYDSSVLQFVPRGIWGVIYVGLVPEVCELSCNATDVDAGGGLRRTGFGMGVGTGTTWGEGVIAVVRYQCVGPGTAMLRLVPPTGGPWTGTTTFDSSNQAIPTGLTAGYIECYAPPTSTPTVTPTPTATATPTPTSTPTATATPTLAACMDWLGDTSCDGPTDDADNDGCTDAQEAALGGNFQPNAWYDVYDVPAPARADAEGANGTRNGLVDMADVLAVLYYAFTQPGGPPNADGVAYDAVKGTDLDGDGIDDVGAPPGIVEGLKYDRSAGLGPDPVTGIDPAGPPNWDIDMADALAALAQAFAVDCSGP